MKIRVAQFLLVWAIASFITAGSYLCFSTQGRADVQPQTPSAATASAKGMPEDIKAPQPDSSTFTYRLEGRPDPFLPFLTDKAQTNADEIVEANEKLTGMQLFEPGQLTLVALVRTDDQKFAMVQDVTGKGYIIEEGTKIGQRGVVTAIVPNKVVIEESATTRSGKKLMNTIEMVLRKEEKKK